MKNVRRHQDDGRIYGYQDIADEDELEIKVGVTVAGSARRRAGETGGGPLPRDEVRQAAADFFRRRLALREKPTAE